MEGLDAIADDALIKPFAIEGLAARLRALQRRHHSRAEGCNAASGPLSLPAVPRRPIWFRGS
jgi:DNA-binding response OmpR family regulator